AANAHAEAGHVIAHVEALGHSALLGNGDHSHGREKKCPDLLHYELLLFEGGKCSPPRLTGRYGAHRNYAPNSPQCPLERSLHCHPRWKSFLCDAGTLCLHSTSSIPCPTSSPPNPLAKATPIRSQTRSAMP